MNEMGWYRKCEECKHLVKLKGPEKSVLCYSKGTCNSNKNNSCEQFERIWWQFWVPSGKD